jgi:hypothetical protein
MAFLFGGSPVGVASPTGDLKNGFVGVGVGNVAVKLASLSNLNENLYFLRLWLAESIAHNQAAECFLYANWIGMTQRTESC